jgi:hypothetical protein
MLKTRYIFCFLLCFLVLQFAGCAQLYAQVESDESALLEVQDGISISKDSLFLLNLRFRMQNRFGMQTFGGDDLGIDVIDARVRRLRLRFDGYVMNERLQYYIQLSFSRADQELDQAQISQTVRDAILYYRFSRRFYVGFGQAKLPGNRQRVVSSGNMQFADRSLVNNELTIDRDFGFFAYWTNYTPAGGFKLKTALTTGEGRGSLPGNNGLAYTARFEWLPLGEFTGGGDYSEGDLVRETKPKLSFGAGINQNYRAQRVGGQLGLDLHETRDITTFMADAVFKYKGWALSSEWIGRNVDNPFTYNADSSSVRLVYKGSGINNQLSYYWPNGHELALRYTYMQPSAALAGFRRQTEELWLGWNRYLNGHRIKAQVFVRYRWLDGQMQLNHVGNHWATMLQVEFGI